MALPQAEHDEELLRQFSALLDGMLPTEALLGLQERLAADPAALAEYCAFMDTESMLAWELASRAATTAWTGEAARPARTRRRPSGAVVRLASAAALGSALVAAVMLPRGAFDDRPRPAAIVSRSDAAVWHRGLSPAEGQPVPDGGLVLLEGTAQLTFAQGAVVIVHAPAEVEVLGGNRFLLRRGRITPFVPAAARGFTVVAPTGDIVDLGTEFSMSVGDDGQTDVFVIDGEVDVGRGKLAATEPMRLTQGFASRLAVGVAAARVTQRPILMERFDAPTPLFRRIEMHADDEPLIVAGELRIPIEGRRDQADPTVQVMLDRDLTAMVGTRSTISYKISLPAAAGLTPNRWAGLAIDPGEGPLPWAHKPGTAAGVLVSPAWQVGLYVNGTSTSQKSIWPRQSIFPRGSEAVGPYQVLITIDDTPSARTRLGGAAFGFMVNGVEFVRDQPIRLGPRPRIAFQTFLTRGYFGLGYAAIDDLSISVEVVPEPEAS